MTRTPRLIVSAAVLLITALAIPVIAPAGPVSAAAVTRADIKLSPGPAIRNARISKYQAYYIIYHVQDLGPDNANAGVVRWEYWAPGGTHFVSDPTNLLACHIIVPLKHYWCTSTGELMANKGEDLDTVAVMVDSTKTTPGRITATCTCDPNPGNNTTTLVITTTAGATPSPTHHPSPTPTKHATPSAHASASVSPAASVPTPTETPSATPPPSPAPAPDTPSATNVALKTSSNGPGAGIYLAAVGAVLVAFLLVGAVIWRRRRGQASTT